MFSVLNFFFNKKSTDSSPFFQGVVDVPPKHRLGKTQLLDVAVSAFNTSLPICQGKEITQAATAVAIYKPRVKETVNSVVKRLWNAFTSNQPPQIQDFSKPETDLSRYYKPSKKRISDLWNDFFQRPSLRLSASDQGLSDLSQVQQIRQPSYFSWLPGFKSSMQQIIHPASDKISDQNISATLSDKHENSSDIFNAYGKYILSGILTLGACYYFYKKISSPKHNKNFVAEEDFTEFQKKIREVVNRNIANNSILVGTGPVTTDPITTGPITTGPITTGPITTGPITTGPITTGPITTNSVPADATQLQVLSTSNASLKSSLLKKMITMILFILKTIQAVFNVESLFVSKDGQKHKLSHKI
jgi:hypothetical protein